MLNSRLFSELDYGAGKTRHGEQRRDGIIAIRICGYLQSLDFLPNLLQLSVECRISEVLSLGFRN